jgi:hypothetical protein
MHIWSKALQSEEKKILLVEKCQNTTDPMHMTEHALLSANRYIWGKLNYCKAYLYCTE